jgi:WD repeat-containing protein 19
MEALFVIDTRHHGLGPIIFAWHPEGTYVASTGNSRVVHIFDNRGGLIDQIEPPHPSVCTALEWDKNGEVLAIMQQQSSVVVLWELQTKTKTELTTSVKDLSFLQWSKVGPQLAMGSGKGSVAIYDKEKGEQVLAVSKHKKRIVCGDWNLDNKFAYGSEDRQITIVTADGETVDQVKVKCRPSNIKFGGKQYDKEAIVSVNMEGRAILLYDLNNRDNALELAFQQRYGSILNQQWFGDGYIMAGFSSGYVVVISTHLHEIGREQFCAKFHDDQLRDLTHCPATQRVATCGDNCIKLIDMADWKEITTEIFDKEAGQLDRLAWSSDGQILSVSTKNGCLYNFTVHRNLKPKADKPQVHSAMSKLLLKPFAPSEIAMIFVGIVASLLFAISSSLQLPVYDVCLVFAGISANV